MTTRGFLLALIAPWCTRAQSERCPVQLHVGPHKHVSIVWPSIAQGNLADLIGSVMGRDLPKPTEDLKRIFRDADSITFVITSKCALTQKAVDGLVASRRPA